MTNQELGYIPPTIAAQLELRRRIFNLEPNGKNCHRWLLEIFDRVDPLDLREALSGVLADMQDHDAFWGEPKL